VQVEGEVLGVFGPIYTMGNAIGSPTVKCFWLVCENFTIFPFGKHIVGKLDSWAFLRYIQFQHQSSGVWEISKNITTVLRNLRPTQQGCRHNMHIHEWTPRHTAGAGYSPPRRGPFPNYFGQTCLTGFLCLSVWTKHEF